MYLGGNLCPTQVRETGIVLAGASGASGSAQQVPRPCTSSVPLASASVWWCSLPCPLDCNLTPAPASLRYPPSRVSNLRHLSTSLFPSHPLYFLPIPPSSSALLPFAFLYFDFSSFNLPQLWLFVEFLAFRALLSFAASTTSSYLAGLGHCFVFFLDRYLLVTCFVHH